MAWPRVDDRRVVSGIVDVIHKVSNERTRLRIMGHTRHFTTASYGGAGLAVFDRIFAALAGDGPKPKRIMIDATHLKAHRTAASLLKKGLFPVGIGRMNGGLNSKLPVVATAPESRSCSPKAR